MGVTSLSGITIPITIIQVGNKNTVKTIESTFAALNKQLRTTATLQNKLSKSTKKYNDALKNNTSNIKKNSNAKNQNNDSITRLLKSMNKLRWTMVNVGFVMTTLAAIAFPVTELAKYGMELESLFTKVEVVTGATADSALQSIRDLRDGTMFSIEEMGNGFLEFSKQGFSAGETLTALPAIMSLAVTGFTDLDTAVKITAQSIHQFGLEAEDAAHIADVIAKAANISAADVETFGVAMSYAGPIAAQAGLSFEETAASLSILSNMGLNASKSGTSLAAALTKLIKPTDATKASMRKMGLSFFEANGEMKDIDVIIKELSATLGALPDEEKLRFLTEAFGARGARAISGLMKSLESGQGSIATFTERIDDTNYAMEQMMLVQETSAGRLKSAWGDSKDFFIDWADTVNDGVTGILQNFTTGKINSKITDINDALFKYGTTGQIPHLTKESNIIWDRFKTDFMSTMKNDPLDIPGLINNATGLVNLGKLFGAQISRGIDESTEEYFNVKIAIGKGQAISELREQFYALEKMGTIDSSESVEGVGLIRTQLNLMAEQVEDISFGEMSPKNLREMDIKLSRISAHLESMTPDELLKTGETLIDSIIEYQEMDSTTQSINDNISKQFPELEKILTTDFAINESQKESVKLLKEAFKAYQEMSGEAIILKNSMIAYSNLTEDALSFFEERGESKQIGELKKFSEMLQEIRDSDEVSGQGGFLDRQINDLAEAVISAQDLDAQIEQNTQTLDFWNNQIDINNGKIEDETVNLDSWKEKLKDVDKTIKDLEKARFTGQLGVEKLMSGLDHFILQQDFMARTGVTAQEFIQKALGKTAGDYEGLIDVMSNVDSATDNSKDSYDAWQETIQEFIKDAVESGNLLGKNVSEGIKKFSTQLLGTSKFGDENDKQAESVNNLKDAYDLYYGEMTDDVDFASKTHEEANSKIYDSSEDVIEKLKEQWQAQTDANNAIDKSQGIIDGYTTKLDIATTEVGRFTDKIADLKTELDGIANAYADIVEQALKAQKYINTPSSGGTSTRNTPLYDLVNPVSDGLQTGYDGEIYGDNNVPSTGNAPFVDLANDILYGQSRSSGSSGGGSGGSYTHDDGEIISTGTDSTHNNVSYNPDTGTWMANDFVMRPGQSAQRFSPQDTLIGVKDTSKLGGTSITIGDINISGASGDPDEIARRIVEEIRTEMRLG